MNGRKGVVSSWKLRGAGLLGCTFQLLENSKGQKGGGDRSWMVSPVIDWAADHQLDLLRWWREGAASFAFLDGLRIVDELSHCCVV